MGVFDLRGTHGSGKSFVPRRLLLKYPHYPVIENGVHVGYVIKPYDCFLLGKYETVCGGCDGIKTADEVVRRVTSYASLHRNVLLEGILVAHTFKRYSDLAVTLKDKMYTFCFLNTPLEICIARVKARRLAKGNTKELNITNIVSDWRNIWHTVRGKCEAAGHTVRVVDHKRSVIVMEGLLREQT